MNRNQGSITDLSRPICPCFESDTSFSLYRLSIDVRQLLSTVDNSNSVLQTTTHLRIVFIFPDSASDVKLLFEVNIFVQCDRYKHLDDQRDRPPYSMTHCPCINKDLRTWLNAEPLLNLTRLALTIFRCFFYSFCCR